jgi:hypothetical protein
MLAQFHFFAFGDRGPAAESAMKADLAEPVVEEQPSAFGDGKRGAS